MQFTSLPFLLFFPAVAVIAFVLPARLRRAWLLCASLGFYFYGNVKYGVFLLLSIAITYGAARLMAARPAAKKGLLAAGILLNFSFLLFFKYYNFAAENVGALLGLLGVVRPLPLFDVLLPVGISFYTFQSTGYLVDVYRGVAPAENNLATYALYVAFFPQVQSGPISRSTTLLRQMQAGAPGFDAQRVKEGLVLMGWGLFKKLVVADRLAVLVDTVFAEPAGRPGSVLWVGAVLFAFQLYCDFSGYTGMALGAARVLGYELDKNFAQPFLARSVAEFWRRWHISLGGWFKDYLFYPLLRSKPLTALMKKGGRGLPKRLAKDLATVAALLVVWLATGLWHGAAWTFVVFGLYHGLLIILGTVLAPELKKLAATLHFGGAPAAVWATVRTFFLVCVGFVFFKSPTMAAAFAYLRGMFSAFGGTALANGALLELGLGGPALAVCLAGIALVVAVDAAAYKRDVLAWLLARKAPLQWAVYLAGLLAIVIFGAYGEGVVEKPFIYFQF